MGQKVNPTGFRLGITENWRSTWFAGKSYAQDLHADICIRKFLMKKLRKSGVSHVDINRTHDKVSVVINTSKPGMVIGRKGALIETLTKSVQKLSDVKVEVLIQEIKKPELSAKIIAENIAMQLEGRVHFRRAMKFAITNATRSGLVKGIKIRVSGRLGGSDMARTEEYKEGRIPLHTLRAHINYAAAEALTTYGITGVKVWVYHDGDESRASQ